HLLAAAARHVHVEEHDVRLELLDRPHRGVHVPGLADDLDLRPELGTHAGPEQPVAVHDQHPGRHGSSRFIVNVTSVPSPGAVRIRAAPPFRSIRPMIDSRMPMRSGGTASRSNPLPRSRTKTVTSSGSTSAYTETTDASEYFAAFTIACRAACTSALSRGVR